MRTQEQREQRAIRALMRTIARRRMAVESVAEVNAIIADWTPEQIDRYSPENARQRGELRQIVRTINGLPDAAAYARRHRGMPPESFSAEAAAAAAWLTTFAAALEEEAEPW